MPQTSPDDDTGEQRQAKVGEQREWHVVTMLEREYRITLEVRNVGEILPPARVLAQHPADVREPEAAPRRIRIPVLIIDVQVMGAVPARPGEHAVLQRHGAEHEQEQPQAPVRLIGAVRPEAVVAGRNRHAARPGEEQRHRPGAQREPMDDAVPRHGDQGDGSRQKKHQGVDPDEGRLGLGARGCVHAGLCQWMRGKKGRVTYHARASGVGDLRPPLGRAAQAQGAPLAGPRLRLRGSLGRAPGSGPVGARGLAQSGRAACYRCDPRAGPKEQP